MPSAKSKTAKLADPRSRDADRSQQAILLAARTSLRSTAWAVRGWTALPAPSPTRRDSAWARPATIRKSRGWIENQGFTGYSEVEIFSSGHWWQRDGGEVLDTCIARHRSAV